MTLLTSHFSATGDARVFAGEVLAARLRLQDGNGQQVDTTGRTFRMTAYKSRTREELLAVGAEGGTGDIEFAFLGDDTEGLFAQDPLRIEIVEVLAGGVQVLVEGSLSVVRRASGSTGSASPPASDAPYTVIQMIQGSGVVTVSETGAPGLSAAQLLYATGTIDAPTADALDAYLQQVGADAVAAQVTLAQTARSQAQSAATQTGLDRVATGQDRTATAADRAQTGADRTATGQDRTATGQDRTATAADRVQTGQDRTATAASATAAQAAATVAIDAQASTAYTLAAADQNAVVRLTNAAAVTLTIPTNATVPLAIGCFVEIHQAGAGVVTITPAAGVTVQARGGLSHTAGQYALAGLRKVATDTWVLTGDLA